MGELDPLLSAVLGRPLPRVSRRASSHQFSAIVLGAGAGRRLHPLTLRLCKPLAPILNVPMLYWGLAALRATGAQRAAINAFHLADQIEQAATELRAQKSLPITVVEEERLTGPAGGMLACRDALPPSPYYVVMNGDIVTSVDLAAMIDSHVAYRADLTVLAQSVADPTPFGTLHLRGRDITGISEKSSSAPPGSIINCGVYVFSHDAFYALRAPAKSNSFDFKDILPQLQPRRSKVLAHISNTYWNDAGTLDALLRANLHLLASGDAENVAWPDPATPELWRQGELIAPLQITIEGRSLVAENLRIDGPVTLKNTVVGAHAHLGAGVHLREVVVLPHARLLPGTRLENCIAS